VEPLVTVGHGTASRDELTALLHGAGVGRLIDVRRYPGSRAHPHVRREELAGWLPDAGIGYRSDERLGGRRRLPPESPDAWWQVAAFRAYAAHMRTAEFRDAVTGLLADAAAGRTAVMCSESLWWRCHRRLIADHLVLVAGVPVVHLDHRGGLAEHRPAEGARRDGDVLIYDRVDKV
jgi:uncharacterized protein (DUF488 family)